MKGSKKYRSYEYASVNEYLPKALTNDVTDGSVTKKPRFGKRKVSKKEKPIKYIGDDHDEQ